MSCAARTGKASPLDVEVSEVKTQEGADRCENMSTHEKRRQALLQHFHLNFFKGAIAISTIGTYITFQLVVQPEPVPSDILPVQHIFEPATSRTFLAAAWLLFLLTLGLSVAALLSLSFNHATSQHISAHPNDNASAFAANIYAGRTGLFGWNADVWAGISTAVISLTMPCAFLFTCLSVATYNAPVGIIGVVIVVIFIIIAMAVSIRHLVTTSRSKRSSLVLEPRQMSHLGPEVEAGLWNMMTQGGTIPMQPQHTANQASVSTKPGTSTTRPSTRPSTRRHQPIVIKDPRMAEQPWVSG